MGATSSHMKVRGKWNRAKGRVCPFHEDFEHQDKKASIMNKLREMRQRATREGMTERSCPFSPKVFVVIL